MATSIKTSKDGKRKYLYEQHTTRVNGKPVTKGKYIGPLHPKRKKDGLTLGIILGGLMRASAQSFAPKHEKKEYHSRPRAPDIRTQEWLHNQFVDLAQRDPKAAIEDIRARAPVSQPIQLTDEQKADVKAWNATMQSARGAEKAVEAAPPSTPAPDSAPAAGEAHESGETV